MEQDNPRRKALEILSNFERDSDLSLDFLINQGLNSSSFDSRDRRFVYKLVVGTIKQFYYLNFILNHFLDNPENLSSLIRIILRLGVYQIEFLDSVPNYSAVNETVELTREAGYEGMTSLVNSVLRNVIRQRESISFPSKENSPVDYLKYTHSFPQWLAERWYKRLGLESAERMMKWSNEKSGIFIRLNRKVVNLSKFSYQLYEEGYDYEICPYFPSYLLLKNPGLIREIPGYDEGEFWVQNPAFQLPVELLDPSADERVLEIGTAPGGKLFLLAEYKNLTLSNLFGLDKSFERLKTCEENLERLNLGKAKLIAGDGSNLAVKDRFDKILIDAPCSGFGILRSKPEGKLRKSPSLIDNMSKIQRKIIKNVPNLLRSGGEVVYSTCTNEYEENEAQVEWFLNNNFEIIPPDDLLPPIYIKDRKWIKTFPDGEIDRECPLDGCFACKLKYVG